MTPQYERLQKCYEIYKEKIHFEPRVALVLGSVKTMKDAT